MKYIILLVITLILTIACQHKTNFNNINTISYLTKIQPIIISNCTQSGCHGNINAQKFMLLTYDDVIINCKVKAGSPKKSKLYSVIKTYNSEEVMPQKPYNALSEKQIQLIYVWIGQGALNN